MVAWTPVRSSDTRDQLVKATMHLPAERHFVDEERLVGQAVARMVCGADRIAWDTYLFYSPGATWDSLGDPTVWLHGLKDCNWVPPERYCSENREAAFAEALASLD